MVWHKPWIDHLPGGFDVILAAKPTTHVKTLFHGIGGSRRWLNWGAFLGREARNERPYRKLGRYAQANGFGPDQPHWHMSANDGEAQAVLAFCDAHNINPYSSNGPYGREMVVFSVGAMDAERQWKHRISRGLPTPSGQNGSACRLF